jgi:putative ABC transport system permease protein
MKEILRNLARRKLRSTLTISGIVIGIFALTTMGAVANHFNALIDGGVVYFGSNIQVGDDSQGIGGTSFLPLSKQEEIKRVDGVAAVFPSVQANAKPGAVAAVSFGVPDYITNSNPDENQYSAFKIHFAQGSDVQSNGEVALGSSFANEFKKKVGDSIDLPIKPSDARPNFINHPYTVVGILAKTETAPDTGAYVTLHDVQTILKDQLPPAIRDSIDTSTLVTNIVVYGKPGVNLDQLAAKINAEVPGVKAAKPSDIVASFKSGGAIFTAITTGAALLALVIGGLSVINTMIMAVTERIREIGLKKAVGAHTGQILREYLIEATMIGLIGGVVGFLLGALLAAVLNLAGAATNLELFLVTPGLALLALGFAVALGALAGIAPAFRAARLDPVTALRMQS